MRFYTGHLFPSSYEKNIFIAEHGSWNSIQPMGYKISLVRLSENRVLSYEDFAVGFVGPDGKVCGRPVDIIEWLDGSLLVSDDFANKIYRISYFDSHEHSHHRMSPELLQFLESE